MTEQYYLRARYYTPTLGRFLQEDVYQGDGLNLYAYCGNNPVAYYDPSGFVMEESDYFKIKYDTDGQGYAYYQNKNYKDGLKCRGYSTYYEGKSFEAHHLLQGKWADVNLKDMYGYEYKKAPTISLGTGWYKDNSGNDVQGPHTIANNRQKERARERNRDYTLTTLEDELIFGATDLLEAGMSEKLVISELERNYKMLDALNNNKKAEIEAGTLEPLKYNREEIEKVVHEKAELLRKQQGQTEDEEIKSTNC